MEILGWTPSNGSFEEVGPSSMFETPLENWYGLDAQSPVLEVTPPQPSTSSPYYRPPPVTQRRVRGPDHIPRPRNSFIIFRCEYTRQHCNGKDERESSEDEKRTLSKRAGEAWKKVSPDVKRHYKQLADAERDEHARQNPDYRYRPRRRQNPNVRGVGKAPPEVAPPKSGRSGITRSRSSSLSSANGNGLNASTPVLSQGSTLPTPTSSLCRMPSLTSRGSSPDTRLGYPSGPESPYTPSDSAPESLFVASKTSVKERLLAMSSIPVTEKLLFDYDNPQFLGMLDMSAPICTPADLCIPAPAEPEMIPGNEFNVPVSTPPLTAVASSLAGWDGGFSSNLHFAPHDSSLQGGLGYENLPFYQNFDMNELSLSSIEEEAHSLELDVQNSLNAYALGLNDYGISSFDSVAVFPAPS